GRGVVRIWCPLQGAAAIPCAGRRAATIAATSAERENGADLMRCMTLSPNGQEQRRHNIATRGSLVVRHTRFAHLEERRPRSPPSWPELTAALWKPDMRATKRSRYEWPPAASSRLAAIDFAPAGNRARIHLLFWAARLSGSDDLPHPISDQIRS